MDCLQEILIQIYREWNIDIFVFGKDGKKIREIARQNQGKSVCVWRNEQLTETRQRCVETHRPIVQLIDNHIYCMAFLGRQEELYVLGPVMEGEMSEACLHSFRIQNQISDPLYSVPVLSMERMCTCLSFAYGMLTGNIITFYELIRENVNNELLTIEELEQEISRRDEEEHTRYGEDVERKWLESIANGEILKIGVEQDGWRQVGRMVENDTLKQNEYIAIGSIVLAQRAAIYGGADWEEMLLVGEKYMQKIAKCTSPLEILQIQQLAIEDIVSHVRKARIKQRQYTDYHFIRQCKNYINSHLRERITLLDVAGVVGLNASYLSKLFAEQEGIPIKRYIRLKKLERAANMLKYSQEEISSISSYFQFNSQSYFGQIFKKEYGMTPLEYRRNCGWKAEEKQTAKK